MSEIIKIELKKSDIDKENPILAKIYKKDMPFVGGLFSKEKILQIIKETIDKLDGKPDLKLCTDNIETLGNAIKRIDADIDTIKKTHKNIEVLLEVEKKRQIIFEKRIIKRINGK